MLKPDERNELINKYNIKTKTHSMCVICNGQLFETEIGILQGVCRKCSCRYQANPISGGHDLVDITEHGKEIIIN